MRKVIVALLLFSLPILAAPGGAIKDTSITNIDSSYAGAANEFIAGTTDHIGGVIVVNPSSTGLFACVYALDVGDCTDDMYVPANSFRTKRSNYIRGLWLRAETGVISTGVIEGTGE